MADHTDPRAVFISKRRGKFLAQTLEAFEEMIEPHLAHIDTLACQLDTDRFKALVRQRYAAFAQDVTDVLGFEVNMAGQEVRDRLHTTGRP